MAPGKRLEMLPVEDTEKYVEDINKEKQEEADKKKSGGRGASGAASSSSAAIPTRTAGGDGITEPSAGNA